MTYELYGSLAAWWPLISPPDEYVGEAAFAASLLSSASSPADRPDVLDLGSGGGHMAVHLKNDFSMTLVDLSDDMLAISRLLNPECEHLIGDMRTVRIGREFDAVLVHDAIDYMTTESDLRQAVETAAAHCRRSGLAVFIPDYTVETFEPGTEHGGGDSAHDGRGARFLAWSSDPDPADTTVSTEYVFLLREHDQSVRVVHETHVTGLFTRDMWLRLMAEAGFEPYIVKEQTSEDRIPRDVFVGRRT